MIHDTYRASIILDIRCCLSVGLFVSKKRQTGEAIGPKFCVGPQGRFQKFQNFQNLASNKILFLLNFENPRNKISELFACYCLKVYTNRNRLQLK